MHTLHFKCTNICTSNAKVFVQNATWGELYFADTCEQSNNLVLANLGFLLRMCWWFVAGSKCLKDYCEYCCFYDCNASNSTQSKTLLLIPFLCMFVKRLHAVYYSAGNLMNNDVYRESDCIPSTFGTCFISRTPYSVLRTKPTTRGWAFSHQAKSKSSVKPNCARV